MQSPRLSGERVDRAAFSLSIRRLAAALVTAAAFTLLIATAGRDTRLSDAVDTILAGHNMEAKITGFITEAGEIYRSGRIRR